MSDGHITRDSLGRVAKLGSLYDARSDQFRTSCFQFDPPQLAISVMDSPHSDVKFEWSNSVTEKLEKLNVSAELKLSVLAGLVTLEGSGKYLTKEKKSAKGASASLIYDIHTKTEELNLFYDGVKECVSIDAIECAKATHIVTGVVWGAKCIIEAEFQSSSFTDRKKIEGFLKAHFKRAKIVSLTGCAEGEYENKAEINSDKFNLRVYGDVLPDEHCMPQDIDQALALMKSVPQLVQRANNGKGKPLFYMLYPLEILKQRGILALGEMIDVIVRQLAETSIREMVNLFEDFTLSKQQLHDVWEVVSKYRDYVLQTDVRKVQMAIRELSLAECDLKAKLSILLVEVRTGKKPFHELMNLKQEFEKDGILFKTEDFITSCEVQLAKIKLIGDLCRKGVVYLKGNHFYDFISSGNVFVLFLKEGDQIERSKQLRLFYTLLQRQGCSQEVKFALLDCDNFPEIAATEGITSVSIYHEFNDGFKKQVTAENLHSENKNLEENARARAPARGTDEKPSEEINILVLGETGVGKSTWINAFLNYCTYASLDEASNVERLLYHVPSQFTTMTSDFQQRTVTIGQDNNESYNVGSSSTQSARSYLFPYKNTTIRLIDTPGVGDTRGYDRDQINFDGVLSFLTQNDITLLHGVCILLKPNDSRLTVMFRFCIKELLTHFHRDAIRNIVFCFTNSRNTFYRPGDTYPALQKLLSEQPDVSIPLNYQTVYCMDNEAFRFLVAMKNGIEFNDKERDNYKESWRHSVAETNRMIDYIMSKEPHSTRDTLSLNGARQMVLDLTRPIADISQNIQLNLDLIRREKDKIKLSKKNKVDLARNLTMPQVDIVVKQLDYPRTVCTGPACRKLVQIGNVDKWHFPQVCHDHCYLEGIGVENVGHPGLQECDAMDDSSTPICTQCNCLWNMHMHITYETEEEEKMVTNKNVQMQINNEDDAIRAIEKHLKGLEKCARDLEYEQKEISKICALFGSFLKANAISTYNDALREYLEHLIRQEKEKLQFSNDRNALDALEQTLRAYEEEVKVLTNATARGAGKTVAASDIPVLIQQLYDLPIKGKDLENIMKAKKTGDYLNKLGSQKK